MHIYNICVINTDKVGFVVSLASGARRLWKEGSHVQVIHVWGGRRRRGGGRRWRGGRGSLTSLGREAHVLVDGTEEVLLLAAQLPGSQDVPDTLVQVGVLALGRGVAMATGSGGEQNPWGGGATQDRFSHLRLHHV